MASIIKRKNGIRAIQFCTKDGRRPTVSLGKVPQRTAEAVKVKIERLVAASMLDQAIDDETARWLGTIDDAFAQKLSVAGLIAKRETTDLGGFIDSYIADRTDVKHSTSTVYGHTRRNLIEFLGADVLLRDITRADADAWRRWLAQDEGLSDNTVRRRCGIAKQFFHTAVKARLVTENVFDHLKGGVQSNPKRSHFIDRGVTEAVLRACPDDEWRVLFALTRYGGLRCPSEHLALRWESIDFQRGRMTVKSPKTAHHANGKSRVVPIFPELRPYLVQWHATTPDPTGEVILTYRRSETNLRTRLLRIIKRAGQKPWPKIFTNLRSSRATELANEFPPHVAAAWLGHSTLIAQRHYWQVTDADFDRAVGESALQKPVQQSSATVSNAVQIAALGTENPVESCVSRGFVGVTVGGKGLEPLTPSV